MVIKMKQASRQKGTFYLVRELWDFLKVRKKWWLLPILMMLLLVGVLIIFAETSPISPFVYTLI